MATAGKTGGRVVRFTLDSAGAPVGTPSTFGSSGTDDGQLDHRQGVGVDADSVYVADDRNDRVVRFSHAGTYLGQTTGNATAPLSFADDASVDSPGRLYVADSNHRVQVFDAATFLPPLGAARNGDRALRLPALARGGEGRPGRRRIRGGHLERPRQHRRARGRGVNPDRRGGRRGRAGG